MKKKQINNPQSTHYENTSRNTSSMIAILDYKYNVFINLDIISSFKYNIL